MKFSLIIPVYRNESTIASLLLALVELQSSLRGELSVLFVVDGSPDASFNLLQAACDQGLPFESQLIAHSRNYGSFPAIRTGLLQVEGEYCAVMAADLQEPIELIRDFFHTLSEKKYDVVVGSRENRRDPFFTRVSSNIFWMLYRRFVISEIPKGGVDVFGCNRRFKDELLKLEESRSSLIALIFWLGFERKVISYSRKKRTSGKSGWTLKKKLDYMSDSIFAFTDLPIRLLLRLGLAGCFLALFLAAAVGVCYLLNLIQVPGYTATMIVILFFSGLNMLALGVVGSYAWRAYENSKQRPIAIVARKQIFQKASGSLSQRS